MQHNYLLDIEWCFCTTEGQEAITKMQNAIYFPEVHQIEAFSVSVESKTHRQYRILYAIDGVTTDIHLQVHEDQNAAVAVQKQVYQGEKQLEETATCQNFMIDSLTLQARREHMVDRVFPVYQYCLLHQIPSAIEKETVLVKK